MRGKSVIQEPSPWVARFAPLVAPGAKVLDLACGGGRHSRLFVDLGHHVLAVDSDISKLGELTRHPRLEILQCDLEDDGSPTFLSQKFDAIVVTNYLHRPLLPAIAKALSDQGVLIYETFALGNEQFGRPSNPAYLLRPGELLDWLAGTLRIIAYEDVIIEKPSPAAVQRVCARRE